MRSLEKFGFIKLSFKETGVDIKNLSKKILTEFLKFNFLNYPTPPASSKIKNITNKVRVLLQIRFNKFLKNKEVNSSFVPKNTEFVINMQKTFISFQSLYMQ